MVYALFDFRRSAWLRPKAAAEVGQCCKNCLLVICTVCSLQSVHGVGLVEVLRCPVKRAAEVRMTDVDIRCLNSKLI